MKTAKIAVLSLLAAGLLVSVSFAAGGDVAKGKAMFNDAKLNGAPGVNSCNSCHPDGKALEKAGAMGRKDWTNPGGTWLALEDANNVCVIMAVKGKALDPRSQEMADLVAYIKSLARK